MESKRKQHEQKVIEERIEQGLDEESSLDSIEFIHEDQVIDLTERQDLELMKNLTDVIQAYKIISD